MREIKFRAKYFDEWYFGIIVTRKVKDRGRMRNLYILMGLDNENWIPLNEDQYDTIGQFTGLQDSKDNDIYEGDILCITQHELDILRGVFRETEIICVVEFRNGAFIPVMSDGKGYCWSNFIYDKMPTADYTVIGNVHDNPELMEANQ